MALNLRHTSFITELKNFAIMLEQCITKGKCIKDCYDEEFANGLDNALLDVNDDIIQAFSFDSNDVKNVVDYSISNLLQYWLGNTIPANDNGKFLRRIK